MLIDNKQTLINNTNTNTNNIIIKKIKTIYNNHNNIIKKIKKIKMYKYIVVVDDDYNEMMNSI